MNFLERTEPGRYFGSDLPIQKEHREGKKRRKNLGTSTFFWEGAAEEQVRGIKDWTLILRYRLIKESINVNSRVHWHKNSSLSDSGLEIRDKGIQIE